MEPAELHTFTLIKNLSRLVRCLVQPNDTCESECITSNNDETHERSK
jgi:hypothetical protein